MVYYEGFQLFYRISTVSRGHRCQWSHRDCLQNKLISDIIFNYRLSSELSRLTYNKSWRNSRIIILKILTMQDTEKNQLNLLKLKRLITSGIESIPMDRRHSSAIMVIGDTGVGKTTILSFLAKRKLMVKIHGLNTILDSDANDGLRIGHDRFSETRVPTKIMIEDNVFFDCSGFKDNRGQQYQISNSFFVQRLFNIYDKIKILLIIDQSSISEARADKLPKLLRNLLNSFESLTDIQDGVILLINRAKPDFSEKAYLQQILKMAKLKGSEGNLFNREEQAFLDYLVKNKRVSLFKQAQRQHQGKQLLVKQQNLLALITDAHFVKSKKIKNIISESAKLSIREYIDRLSLDAEEKIKVFVHNVIKEFSYQSKIKYGSGLQASMEAKKKALAFNQTIQNSSLDSLSNVILEGTNIEMNDLQEGISTILFFQNIYNKSDFYVKLLKTTISAEITKLLVSVDEEINRLQEEQRKFNEIQQNLKKEATRAAALEEAVRSLQNERQQYVLEFEKQRHQHKKEVSGLQSELTKLIEKFTQEQKLCATQEQQSHSQYQAKIRQLQARVISQNTQTAELKAVTNSMKSEIEAHLDEIEMLNVENVSLKRQLDLMAKEIDSKDSESVTSKTSKYPEVVCPHFKNGGKCVHCIRAWKAEQKNKI